MGGKQTKKQFFYIKVVMQNNLNLKLRDRVKKINKKNRSSKANAINSFHGT